MSEEARLEPVASGLAPAGEGWFVVNVRDAAWLTSETFGARCVFEADTRVLGDRTDLEVRHFPHLGIRISLLEPGKPSGMYHAETQQEDFLVLFGECLLIVEGEERTLRAWDFVHCPPGTEHVFVGAGDGPCAVLMVGARREGGEIVYPRSQAALRRGAGVEAETRSPHEAYAPFPHWRPARPPELPF